MSNDKIDKVAIAMAIEAAVLHHIALTRYRAALANGEPEAYVRRLDFEARRRAAWASNTRAKAMGEA
jgi:hypothetical protein